MKKIERCNYGRINYEKRRLLLGALLMVAIGVAVFVLGLLLNKFEKRNIFTVAAVCMVRVKVYTPLRQQHIHTILIH